MNAQSNSISWESALHSRAYEALGARRAPVRSGQWAAGSGRYSVAGVPAGELRAAYQHCERLTKSHSRTFYLASSLLSPAKRRAVRALYAFCRVSDDLVDRHGADPRSDLVASGQWLVDSEASSHYPLTSSHRVSIAWADARLRYGIPDLYAQQLLDGVALDLEVKRYSTFEELAAYCYGVASTVGLMTMHIMGFSGPEAVPYAVKLGVALQLTNILRDVGEDWRAGRLYLPREELEAFGLAEADLQAGQVNDRWRRFMRFQIERNRRLYMEAWPGIAMLSRDARPAIAAAAGLYQAILRDIERHDMDVFSRRAHLSGWEKLRRLPGVLRSS